MNADHALLRRGWRAAARQPLITVIAAALLTSACSGPRQSEKRAAPAPLALPREGAVSLTLPRLGGGQVSVGDLRGHPVLITLFTTWCLRCQAEAPRFVQLHEELGPRGLKTLGVVLDIGKSRQLIQTYVEFVGFTFDVLTATPDNLELVAGLGATPQVPRTVLLDRQGRIALDQLGQTDFRALRTRLAALLAAPTPPS